MSVMYDVASQRLYTVRLVSAHPPSKYFLPRGINREKRSGVLFSSLIPVHGLYCLHGKIPTSVTEIDLEYPLFEVYHSNSLSLSE